MKLKEVISLVLLSIYSIVLFHDIIPHHHHDKNVVFGFNTSSCEVHNHDGNEHNHKNHNLNCNESEKLVNTCSCSLTHNHSQKDSKNHTNCESFKVQLSKFFAINFYFNYSFEQKQSSPKVLIENQDTPEVVKKSPILRRGPPIHV